MKYAQLIMGTAGTGKSSFCEAAASHARTLGRTIRVANLDPAAEDTRYPAAFDIRELISVKDVAEELGLGPNGALLYCMEYLVEQCEWLEEHLDAFLEDDYLLLDCPGQVELYTHVPAMRRVVTLLQAHGFAVGAAYLIDAAFLGDGARLVSGHMCALAAMVHLELPHILSKSDLVDASTLSQLLSPSGDVLLSRIAPSAGRGRARAWVKLNAAVARLLDEYSLVSFVPCSVEDEASLQTAIEHMDAALAYGEDIEPREPRESEPREAAVEDG